MLSVAVHKDIAEYQPKIVGKMTMAHPGIHHGCAFCLGTCRALHLLRFGAERQRLHLFYLRRLVAVLVRGLREALRDALRAVCAALA